MKVLLFTYAYPPMRYPRSIQISRLVKHLRGSVDVVCCNEVGATPDTTLPDRFERNPGEIFRFDYRPRGGRFLQKVLNVTAIPDALLGWSLRTGRAVAAQVGQNGYQAFVTFGQPMSIHLAGLILKKRLGLPWIAHFSDPWADNPYHGRNVLRRWASRVLEAWVARQADGLVFTSQQTLDLVMKKYPAAWRDKAMVLPHSYDSDLYPLRDRSAAETVVIRHIGNFYPPRSPAVVLQALALIQTRSPALLQGVRFEFIGAISSRIQLETLRAGLPDGLVRFLPSVNYSESLRLMAESDLLLVIDAPFETSVFLPSKLIDYLGAGTPVLAVSPEGTSAEVMRNVGGTVAAAADPADVADKLAALLPQLGLGRPGPALNEAARTRYHAAQVAATFEDMVAAIVRKQTEV